jgi:hypothetical protein
LVSRAYRKCEEILRQLIQEYGPTARVGYPLIEKAIKVTVGHDPRTIQAYSESLVDFGMIKRHNRLPLTEHDPVAVGSQVFKMSTFTLNWKMVADYKQLTFSEVRDKE